MTVEPQAPAHGAHTDNGRPRGYSTLTPFIAVNNPQGALDFYSDVFGARLVNSTAMDGITVHAEIEFSNGRLQLGAAQPAYHLVAADPNSDDVSFSLGIYVPNVDEVVATAVSRGAVLREPVSTFVSGDRFGSILDPFGIRWSVMTRVADLSDAESNKRIDEWAAQMGNQQS